MRVVSLFAGVGGFDLAAEAAGMEVVGQVEIDPNARRVLERHWPDVARWEDVNDVTGADLGAVDVLCGGFPCQDYSVAGSRAGLVGDRGALWWQFHRLIDEVRPRWVVGENVPGLVSSNDGRDFRTIVDSLVDLGYGVVWRVLDAQYFGVAQRRRRVFIVGHSGGVPRPEVLALAEGCAGDSPPSREAGEDVAPSLAARTRGGGGLGTDTELDGALIPATSYALTARAAMDRPESGSVTLIPSVAFAWQAAGKKDASGAFNDDGTTPTLPRSQTLAVASFEENRRAEVLETDVVRSITSSGGKPGQGYPAVRDGAIVRRLTPLECERLQGFPDGWTDICSDTQRYRQMGNAVAVPVVSWIFRRLMAEERSMREAA